jgi:hypothetical protein
MAPRKKKEPLEVEGLWGIWTQRDDGAPLSIQVAELVGKQWRIETAWRELGGRLEPVAVTVAGWPEVPDSPVIADVIRRLPIGSLQKLVRQEGALLRQRVELHPSRITGGSFGPDFADLLDSADKLGGHRGVVTSPEEIEQVAAVYRRAWGRGEQVTKAVADHFHISKSTAGKRIMRARKAGLLDDVRRITR